VLTFVGQGFSIPASLLIQYMARMNDRLARGWPGFVNIRQSAWADGTVFSILEDVLA
jgi:hypothetical protein